MPISSTSRSTSFYGRRKGTVLGDMLHDIAEARIDDLEFVRAVAVVAA